MCKEVEKACEKVLVMRRKRKKDSYLPGMNEVLPHLQIMLLLTYICIVNFNSNFLKTCFFKTLRFISSANFVLVTQTFQGMLIATISVH